MCGVLPSVYRGSEVTKPELFSRSCGLQGFTRESAFLVVQRFVTGTFVYLTLSWSLQAVAFISLTWVFLELILL